MSQNDGREAPIFIETFQQQRRHWYTATEGDAVHRFPVQLDEIWNSYSQIESFDSGDIQNLVNDGDTDPGGIVTLRKNKALLQVPGTTHKFQTQAPDMPIAHVITATKGQVSPVAGDVGPVTTATSAPSEITGYTPVIVDASGTIHPMQAATWVVDGVNAIVEFPYGVPATMVAPFTITYYEYVGATGGGSSAPGAAAWHYVADATAPNQTLCPDPAFPAAAASHFLAPVTQQSTENSGTMIMLDQGKGAFRAGTASGAQWADANRGAQSAAVGADTTASGAQSFAAGATNVASGIQSFAMGLNSTASGERSVVGGGVANTASGDDSVVPGGVGNSAIGDVTWAGGSQSTAAFANAFVWSDSIGRTASAANEVTFGAAGGFRVLGNGASLPAYTAGDIYLDAENTVVTGKLTVTGLIDPTGLQCVEQAANPGTVAAGNGTFWVRNDAPNVPMFTDDAGTDHVLAYAGGGSGGAFENSAGGVTRSDVTAPNYAATNDFVFGSQQLDDTGAAADDARFLFDKGSGAFRAGTAQGTQWDSANRGANSTAFGLNGLASGLSAVISGGDDNTASGVLSTIAGGIDNVASGNLSFVAGGTMNTAGGDISFAAGNNSTASHADTFVWSDSTPRSSTAFNEVTFGAAGGFRVLGNGASLPAYTAGDIYLDATNTVVTGKLTVTGLIDPTGLQCVEQATNPGTVAAGNGTFWVRNDAPNVPMFTDDTGADFDLLVAAGSTVTLASAGGTTLVTDGAGPSLAVKGLTAGTGIAVNVNAGDLEIENTDPGSAVTLSDASTLGGSLSLVDTAGSGGTGPALSVVGLDPGTGITLTATGTTDITVATNTTVTNAGVAAGFESLIATGSTNPAFLTKGLVAGTGVTLSSNGTDITITNSDTGSAVTLASAGGTTLITDGIGPSLEIKGLTAGTGIAVNVNATDLEIENTDPGSAVTLSDASTLGGSLSLVDTAGGGDTGPALSVAGLDPGTGITLTATGTTDITVATNTTVTNAGIAAGFETLIATGSANPAFLTKGLVAGVGINLSSNGTDITITNSDSGMAVTLASAGGTTLVTDGTGPSLEIKGLTAGTGIAVNVNAGDLEIENTDPGSAVTLASAGGTTLITDGAGPSLAIKGLTAGTGIAVNVNAGDLEIENADPGSAVTLSDASTLGGSLSLINTAGSGGTGPALSVVGLDPGTGITLTATGTTDITVATNTTVTNAGVAAGFETLIATGSVNPAFLTKGLVAGAGITLSSNGTDITITNSDSGMAVTLTSAGGTTLITDGTGPTLEIKGLAAGTGIAVNVNAGDLEIENTDPGSAVTLSDASTLGGSLSLVNTAGGGDTGPALSVAGLDPGTGITLTATGTTDITIATNTTVTNAGVAAGFETLIATGSTNPAFLMKGLVAGAGITLSSNGTDITITNSDSGMAVTLASAGGTTLITDGIGPSLEIKGLTAGTGIAVNVNAGDLEIENTDPGSAVTLASAGGTTLITDGAGPSLAIKGLTAGTGIAVNVNAGDLEIENTDPGSAVTLSDASTLGGSLSLVNTAGGGDTGPALSVAGLNPGTGITLTVTGTTDITVATNTTVTNAGVAAGFETLIATGSANPAFLTKGLVAGSGITLSSNGTDITITNSDSGMAVTLASAGGTTLVTDGTGPSLEIKGLTAGTGIAVNVNAGDLEIENTDPGSAVTLASAGGTTLITDGAGPSLAIKGLTAGTGIAVNVNAGDLEIENTDPGSAVTLSDASTLGGSLSLVNTAGGGNTGPALSVAGLDPGTGITLTVTGTTDITVATNTTVTNAGVAAGFETLIATGSANPAFLTKGLVAGSGITISSNGTDITITNSDTGSAVTLASAGGTTLVTDGIGPALEIKGLTAGTGIAVNVNAGDLEIENTDPGSAVTLSDASTLGGSLSLVNTAGGGDTGPALSVVGLDPGTGIALTATGTTDITVATNTTLTNAGVAAGFETLIATGSANPAFLTKGLVAGSGIALSSNGTDITIAVMGGGAFENSAGGVTRLNTATPSYAVTNDFVFGSQQLDDSGVAADDARFIFDKSQGFFAAGTATGTQWDTRGTNSVAFGLDSTATFANAFVWSDSTARSASAVNEVTFGAAGGFRVFGNGASSPAYTAGDIYLDATNTVVTGKLTVTGLIDPTGLQCVEQAANPGTVAAGNGTFWVRNDAPNVPMFTDDTGTDFILISPFENASGVTRANAAAPGYATTNDFVFGSPQLDDTGNPADDTRFLFDKSTGALRAGLASGSQWDAANRGVLSVAFGIDTVATGIASAILTGQNNTATGSTTITGGAFNLSSGTDDCIISGSGNTSTGTWTVILGGSSNVVGGTSSVVSGNGSSASANFAWAVGGTSTAAFANSFVWSDSTARSASAANEVTFGAAGGFRVFGNGASSPAYTAGDIYLDAANTVVTGKLTVTGLIDPTGLQCVEQASNPGAVAAGNGTFWVRSDAPNIPMFTDDAGTDFILISPFENMSGVTRANAAAPGYATTNDFVFGSPQLDDSGVAADDARFLFDKSNGAFRAGTATGTQWDAASRGSNSAAFGLDNTGSGVNSAVLGGTSNTVVNLNSAVVGGTGNSNTNDNSCIVAGQNCAMSLAGGVTGNAQNLASGSSNTLTGGGNNVVTGLNNSALASGCTITASSSGSISGIAFGSTPSTSYSSIIASTGSSIASGTALLLSGTNHMMVGGTANAIIGGNSNTMANNTSSVIVGGDTHTIQGFSANSAIIGGFTNLIEGTNAVVAGGNNNTVAGSSDDSAIVGGSNNTMDGNESTITAGATCSIGANAPRSIVAGSLSSSIVSGNQHAIIGGQSNSITGGSSSAVFGGAANTLTGADLSVILGGSNCTVTGSNNSIVGGTVCSTTAPARSVVLGFFASSAFSDTFVWADASNVTATAAPAANTFSVRAAGGTTFWSNATRTLGVNLPPGGVAWAVVSDRNTKENLVELDGDEVLSRVDRLPVFQYNFKGQEKNLMFRGPMAQDWHALFPSAKDNLRIDTMDLDGITLAAVKGLSTRSKTHTTRLDSLEAENASLVAENKTLKAGFAALEARLAALEAKLVA